MKTKKKFTLLLATLCAVLSLSLLSPAFAATIWISPAPTFNRDATETVNSVYHLAPGWYFGCESLKATLERYVVAIESNGHYYSTEWLELDSNQVWYPWGGGNVDFPAWFTKSHTLSGLRHYFDWAGVPNQWSGIYWEATYRVHWTWHTILGQTIDLGYTTDLSTSHNEP